MTQARLTIGELSRRTGVPVKTLRFYSDHGLLPPAARSPSRYRLYDEAAVVRIDLIRSLREAGLDLKTIARVLAREASLAGALRLRLAAVEAHVAALQRVAAALRAALRGGEPDETDVRRLCAVTRLSNDERKAVIQGFYDRVSEGIPIDEQWKRAMVDASAPKLPDDPTPAQLDAWIELAEMVSDPAFVANLRQNASEVWGRGVDMEALRRAGNDAAAAAKDALARGDAPESDAARAVVDRYAAALAAASGRPLDDAMRRGMRERFARQDPRAARYWELVAILKGAPSMSSSVEEWRWVQRAVVHHLQ